MPRKSQKLFDNPRQSSERTNPDYIDDHLTKMVEDMLSLPQPQRITLFQGLESADRRDVLERLRRWPRAETVRVLLDEAERCAKQASAPHGAVCVAGKALDLLLHLLNLDLTGTLGRKLKMLNDIVQKDSARIDANHGRTLVAELLKTQEHIQTRNSAAHYRTAKPAITISEATAFNERVFYLYELEKQRQASLADDLEACVRKKDKKRIH